MSPLKDGAVQFYLKSIPYIDIAILSSSQDKHEYFNTTDYQDVVSYLCYHSFELFLKFAILEKCKNKNEFSKTISKFSHDLAKLYKQYKELYPTKEFDIKHPFNFDPENYIPSKLNPNEQKLFNEHIKKYPPTLLDQNFKYPFDKKADYIRGAYSLKFEKEYLLKFKNKMKEIFNKIYQIKDTP